MRKVLSVLAGVILLCSSLLSTAEAQYLTSLDQPPHIVLQNSTTSATSNGTIMTFSGWFPVIGITASGTFSGATFTIQVSNDGTAWSNANCYTLDGGTNVNTAGWLTAAGNWRCNTAGFSKVQATINSGTPGGVTITAQASPTGVVRDTNNQLQTSQIRTNQSVPPTCTYGCGTGATVVGSDSAFKITLGTTPSKPLQLAFNSTWAAAPACTAAESNATNYVNAATSTTTNFGVNMAAGPTNADVVSVVCIGVQ